MLCLTANSTSLPFFVLGISKIGIIFDGTCLGDVLFLISFLILSLISLVKLFKFSNNKLTHFWTYGIGTFRKRSGAVKIALDNSGSRSKNAVAASDGFFPFRDGVDLLGKAGITGVIQPGGSIRDPETIAAANEHNMSMIFTHERAFTH